MKTRVDGFLLLPESVGDVPCAEVESISGLYFNCRLGEHGQAAYVATAWSSSPKYSKPIEADWGLRSRRSREPLRASGPTATRRCSSRCGMKRTRLRTPRRSPARAM